MIIRKKYKNLCIFTIFKWVRFAAWLHRGRGEQLKYHATPVSMHANAGGNEFGGKYQFCERSGDIRVCPNC